MRLREYIMGDCYMVNRSDENDTVSMLEIDEMALRNSMTTKSLYESGDIAAVIGAVLAWDGVYHVWAVVDRKAKAKGYGKDITRLTLEYMENLHEVLHVKIFMTVVQESIPVNIRWIKTLGYKEEYRIKGAAPDGSDMVGYIKRMEETWHQY